MSEVRCFGIRHHGPGSARSLRVALDDWRPEVVLVEAPQDAAAMLARIGDPALVPPVALLGYVAAEPRRAVFAPFAAFSPEWVAAQWAHDNGVPLRPIDLALAHVLAGQDVERVAHVDPIGTLAAAAGDDDPERWWEDVVEHRGGDDSFAAIAHAMEAVRDGAPPATDLEAAREATMRNGIRAACKSGVERIAVIVGAWHVPALGGWEAADLPAAKVDAVVLKGLAKLKVAVTWVPWTHRRLAASTGYGAGVASPGWYAHVHHHPAPATVTRWFAGVAGVLRSHDMPVSPDHVVAASRLADALAVLRGRPAPGLAEVDDAALAVLADGRAGPLALVRDELVVGDRIGAVPEDVPTVPLARDLAARAKEVRLKPEAGERVLELDLRVPRDLARSHLLHRLWLLDVPWGRPVESRGSVGTFRETWRLRWEPELELRLIDASGRGTTVEAAATGTVLERISSIDTLAELSGLVEVVLLAALEAAVAPLMEGLEQRAAADADVEHLIDALGPLSRAARYGDVRATSQQALVTVIDGLVLRICAGLAPACTGRDDDAAAAMVRRIHAAHAAIGLVDHPARTQQWPAALARVADLATAHGMLRGATTRLLLDGGHCGAEQAGAQLSRALSIGTPAATGAAFVEGFLSGSGTVLLHDATLLGLLDAWLSGLATPSFTDVLPLLRRTFGAFEAAERRRIGELVAGRGDGRAEAAFGWDLDPQRAAAAMATVRQLLGVASDDTNGMNA